MGSYNNYLKSTHWRTLRIKVLKRAGGECEKKGCGRKPTQVHHLTYKRLGHEKLTDLQALCVPCHNNCHPDKRFLSSRPVDANNFECEFCSSVRADLYIGHAKLHFICRGCGESTWRFRYWKKQRMKEGKQKVEQRLSDEDKTCPVCGKILANPHGVKQHMAAKHGISPKKEFVRPKCEKCGKFFDNKNTLLQHHQHAHASRRLKKDPLQCICGQDFSSHTELRKHQRQGHF